jgi:hypothetical protein
MGQVDEDLNPLLDNVVGLLAFDVDNEPDTTGVLLVGRVVHALLGGKSRVNIVLFRLRHGGDFTSKRTTRILVSREEDTYPGVERR